MGGDTILSGDAFGYSKPVRIGACKEECPSGEKGFKLKLKTDNFGSETHWSMTNSLGEVLLRTQGMYTSRPKMRLVTASWKMIATTSPSLTITVMAFAATLEMEVIL
eukprot:9713907-Ditylum_brightwellii.AAC.1